MEQELPKALQKKNRSTKTLLSIFLSIFILLSIASVIYHQLHNQLHEVKGDNNAQLKNLETLKQTPMPLTKKQKLQISQGTSRTTKEKVFYLTGGNFYFMPNTITVNQGDHISIVFSSASGFHDLVSDTLHVRTPGIREGEFTVVKFTVDTKGTYPFYSDISQDRQLEMVGSLIVK